MHILLVEDDESIREVFQLILEFEAPFPDLTVSTCATGGEALAHIREGAPDLVLLDLTLPEEHGFEVFRKIRLIPECSELPVVAVTAHNVAELRMQAMELGFAGYITKPIDFENGLLPLIQKLFPDLRAETHIPAA